MDRREAMIVASAVAASAVLPPVAKAKRAAPAKVDDPLIVIVRPVTGKYRQWIECWSENENPLGMNPYEALLNWMHGWGKNVVKGSLKEAVAGGGALNVTMGVEEQMQGVLVRESRLGEYLTPEELEWRRIQRVAKLTEGEYVIDSKRVVEVIDAINAKA